MTDAGDGIPHRPSGPRPGAIEVDTTLGVAVVEVHHPRGRGAVPGSAPMAVSLPRKTLLIHGASGSARTWDDLLGTPAARAHPGVIAAVHLPGWGDSTGRLPRSARLADMRDSVLACLDALDAFDTLDALDAPDTQTGSAGRWHLVGHSMGGLLALEVAASAPERVGRLTAVSPSASGVIRSVSHPWLTLLGGRNGGGLPALVLLVGGLRPFAGLDRFAPGLVRFADRTGLLRLLVSPLFRHPRAAPRRTVRQLGDEMRPRSFAAATRSIVGYDVRRWRRITVPLTTVEGDRDVFVGERDAAGIAVVLPDTRRVIIPDCGHFPHVERPEAVAALVWDAEAAPA